MRRVSVLGFALLALGCHGVWIEVGRSGPPPGEDVVDGGTSRGNSAPDGEGREDDHADGGARRPPPTASGDLPCAVQHALAASCAECHGSSPRYGAPMPLVTYADLHAASVSDPSVPVYRMVERRIADPERPMPPSGYALAPVDRSALEAWIAAGAPARSEGESCSEPPPPRRPDTGPEALPCTPTHRFLAHAAGDETAPYPVRVDADRNLHTCFAFRNPFPHDTQGTAWAPVIDNERILHHWILWGSQEAPPGGQTVFPCETLPHGDSAFVMGWAPGGGNTVLPDDVGLVLDHPWYYLQVHYYDAAGASGLIDRSGVAVCTTPTPRANGAGVVAFGTVDLAIPPRARNHEESYACPSFLLGTLLGEFTILSTGPHMHRLGRRFRSEVLRADGSVIPLSIVDPWDFENQEGYPMSPPVRVRLGDQVRVTCTYDNPGSTTVRFGENTEDEMCFDFMLVYPITRWPRGIPRFCVEASGLGL